MNTGAWHAGELALQARAGVADRMSVVGMRAVRDHMPQQHRDFFAQLPLLFTGTLDAQGQPWASVRAGAPGFANAPTDRLLRLAGQPVPGDPAAGHWVAGAPVGLLGLQAEIGRRNRMNGTVVAADRTGVAIAVGQSFGNCPKYIHPRRAEWTPAGEAAVERAEGLTAEAASIVAAADTFFIASAHPMAGRAEQVNAGVDVSHRGGPPGFARVAADAALLAPDYIGNFFFATLGNLQLEPRCGLLFLDFATGTRVHLVCRAALLPQPPDPAEWPGALRLLRLEVQRTVIVHGGLPLRWKEVS